MMIGVVINNVDETTVLYEVVGSSSRDDGDVLFVLYESTLLSRAYTARL